MNQSSNIPSQSTENQFLQRDGASQASRAQATLEPDYVSVDERSVKDLLAFAREYAKELQYFDVENGVVKAVEDWSAFVSSGLDLKGAEWDAYLDEIVAFMEAPGKFSTEKASPYTRPHFVLFLTILELLRHAQDGLNTLTRRHLDFYYQQVLRMTKRLGTPDQVNVLVELAPDTEQFLLPAETLLNAGPDSLGQDRFYRTNGDIVINRAQVARLSSVYAEKQIIGTREAREDHDGPEDEAFVKMLEIALGDPKPGDPLPSYETGEAVNYDFLLSLYTLVDFVSTGMFMDFAEFRTLMQLKDQRDHADSEWREINQLLEKAGQKQSNNPNFQLNPSQPRDFDANLSLALGGPPNFVDITQVEDIYDLYDQRIRESVQRFIQDNLYFDEIDDFIRMMQIKIKIDNEWQEINRILELAGQEKQNLDPPYILPPDADPTAFVVNLNAAIGPDYASLSGIENINEHYAALLNLERYFFMSAENFTYLMSVAEKPEATPEEWDKVYAILADAHKAKVYAHRKDRLKQIREEEGFDAMVAFAAQTELASLDRLLESVSKDEDKMFLTQIGQRTDQDTVTETEWATAYRIVELAQRVRLDEPVAQKEEWMDLYPAEDATSVAVELGIEADADHPRWKTFGQGQPEVGKESPPPTEFGWAISSPLLALSQGKHTITLTLEFGADQFDVDSIGSLFPSPSDSAEKDDGPFRIEISTEKGWIEPDTVNVNIVSTDEPETLQALQFELTFAESINALAPLPVEDAEIDSPWPVLKLMLRQIWQPDNARTEVGRYITHYPPFKALVLLRIHLKVAVSGLIPSQTQNDETVLDANKPFEPFGTRAVAGSRFYLGHPELVYNRLDSLHFHVEWMGVPDELNTHYGNYEAITNNSNFTVRISLIDKRVDLSLTQNSPLFASPNAASQPHTISLPDLPATIETAHPGYAYERSTESVIDEDLLAWNRYLQWELNAPDFQHETYPTIAAQKSIALATAISNKKEEDKDVAAKDFQVNPPYTPIDQESESGLYFLSRNYYGGIST